MPAPASAGCRDRVLGGSADLLPARPADVERRQTWEFAPVHGSAVTTFIVEVAIDCM
jgi:hypothetical protein